LVSGIEWTGLYADVGDATIEATRDEISSTVMGIAGTFLDRIRVQSVSERCDKQETTDV
jgi:hypothetical protein